MHQEMAVDTSPNRWATFIRQMIPHHLCAVGMAKLIIKQSTFEEDGEGDSEGYDELQNMGAPQPQYTWPSCLWPPECAPRAGAEGDNMQFLNLHCTATPSAGRAMLRTRAHLCPSHTRPRSVRWQKREAKR